ncbi:hypothetical protein [Clostridium sp.]|uniref:hypothetical protein n=1 Tax=Clostridium sp. TaxID=1506 RepID=UPI002620523B|nr:hypothetical protein [Clostridium sp.]
MEDIKKLAAALHDFIAELDPVLSNLLDAIKKIEYPEFYESYPEDVCAEDKKKKEKESK